MYELLLSNGIHPLIAAPAFNFANNKGKINFKKIKKLIDKNLPMVYIVEAVSNDTSRYGSMVEQLICNQQVEGSSPPIGFIFLSCLMQKALAWVK